MRISAPAGELVEGYEALRAQALGELPPLSPRGLAVLVRGGLVSWMSACPARGRSRPLASTAGSPRELGVLPSAGAELARLLAEMALGSQRRCPA